MQKIASGGRPKEKQVTTFLMLRTSLKPTWSGSMTVILHFFIAEYSKEMIVNDGGGLEHEEGDIEVLELGIDAARQMIGSGEIKEC